MMTVWKQPFRTHIHPVSAKMLAAAFGGVDVDAVLEDLPANVIAR